MEIYIFALLWFAYYNVQPKPFSNACCCYTVPGVSSYNTQLQLTISRSPNFENRLSLSEVPVKLLRGLQISRFSLGRNSTLNTFLFLLDYRRPISSKTTSTLWLCVLVFLLSHSHSLHSSSDITRMIKYEDWNFNSGNYLFTTDTKKIHVSKFYCPSM